MALGLLRAAGAPAAPSEGAGAAAARPVWADVGTGLVTNVLNPKVALFFLAFLPQFIAADTPDKMRAFLWLGAWFVVQGGLFLVAVVALAAVLRRVAVPDIWRRGVQGLAGLLFGALALRLALLRPGAG
jgi:threonine/homoserine/homoserine lactone efflux protein